MIKKSIFALLTACMLPGIVDAAFITDKLAVGLYESTEKNDKPIKVLTSGTPLEILERQGGFARVRLSDSTQGWVESVYITDEKPSKVMLVEAQAKAGGLEKELKNLRDKVEATEKTATGDTVENLGRQLAEAEKKISRLSGELKSAGQRVMDLEKVLERVREPGASGTTAGTNETMQETRNANELQADLQRLRRLVADASALLATAGIPADSGSIGDTARPPFERWQLIVLGLSVVVGFAGGMAWLDFRHRRRHGGYRV